MKCIKGNVRGRLNGKVTGSLIKFAHVTIEK